MTQLENGLQSGMKVNIKYIENRRGSRTLVLNDYMFRLKTEKKGENSYWYCVKPTYLARKNLNEDIPTKLSYIFVKSLFVQWWILTNNVRNKETNAWQKYKI